MIDGKDADTWRRVLRGAVDRGDGAIAADAFVALATIEPTRWSDPAVFRDAVTAAHLAASANQAAGDRVFEVLGGDLLGAYGPDVLYRLTSIHGGSPAAQRANELLAKPELLARATPAMRIALAMRDAPCKSRPALFARAGDDGDERTLFLLQAMRGAACEQISCCMKTDAALEQAIVAVQARLNAKD